MRIRTIAVTNSGIAVSERPVTVISAVGHPPAPQAGDRAAEDAQRDDEDERDGGELERVDERRPEQVGDRDLVLQRRAEVAVEEVA